VKQILTDCILFWQALKRLVYVAKEDNTKVAEYSTRLKTEIDKESPVKTPRPARAINRVQSTRLSTAAPNHELALSADRR
jgi:hypothetical protein